MLEGLLSWAYYVLICIIDETKEHLNAHPNPFFFFNQSVAELQHFLSCHAPSIVLLVFILWFGCSAPLAAQKPHWTLQRDCETDLLPRLFSSPARPHVYLPTWLWQLHPPPNPPNPPHSSWSWLRSLFPFRRSPLSVLYLWFWTILEIQSLQDL